MIKRLRYLTLLITGVFLSLANLGLAQMTGVYTINSALVTAGTNYQLPTTLLAS